MAGVIGRFLGTDKGPRLPSNTYAIAFAAIVAVVILAGLAVGTVCFGPRYAVKPVCELVGTLGMVVGALGGLGATAIASKDVASGGLTSSAGHRVLEARKLAAGTTTVQATTIETTSTPAGDGGA